MAKLSPDRASQLALAVHELMQNAVRHAGGEDVELALCVDPDEPLSVAARNRCTRDESCEIERRLDRLAREEKLQALPDAERYRLQFVSSKASRWERTSLTVLTCFLPAWAEVQTPS